MKLSTLTLFSRIITPLGLLAVVLFPGFSARAEFQDINSTLSQFSQIQQSLQKIQGSPAAANLQPQIREALTNIQNVSQGLGSMQKILNLPVLSGISGVQGASGINDGLEGINAIVSNPIFQNFSGAKELQQKLSSLGNASNALATIGQTLDIPALKNITSLTGVLTGTSVFGGPSSVFGGGPGTGGVTGIGGVTGLGGVSGLSLPGFAGGSVSVQQAQGLLQQGLSALNGVTGSNNSFVKGVTSLVGTDKTAVFGAAQNLTSPNQLIDTGAGVNCQSTGGSFPSISSLGIGNLRGVPTIEQDGSLIRITTENKNLTQAACQQIKSLRELQEKFIQRVQKIEDHDNPKAQELVAEQLRLKSDEDYKKRLTGRKTGQKDAQGKEVEGSFDINRKSYIEEKRGQATAVALKKLADSPMSPGFKQAIISQLEREEEIASDPDQSLQFQLQDTNLGQSEQQGGDFFAGFLRGIEPQNNAFGSYLIARTELDIRKRQAEEDAAQTWEAGGGIPPQEKCISYVETKKGPVCERWVTVIPGKYVGDLSSKYATLGVDQATEAKTETDRGRALAALQTTQANSLQAVERVEGRTGFTLDDGLKLAGAVCQLFPKLCAPKSSGNTTGGVSGTVITDTGTITGQGGITGQGSITGTGGVSGIGGVSGTVITGSGAGTITETGGAFNTGITDENLLALQNAVKVPPTLTIQSRTDRSPIDADSTVFAWRATNAETCTADNDWISFGDNINPTTTPTVVVPRGELVNTQNTQTIFHPTIFKVQVEAEQGLFDNNNKDPGSQLATLTTTFSGNTQTTTFTPNMTDIEPGDIFRLVINSRSIRTRPPLGELTPERVVVDLKTAKVNLEQNDARRTEFDKYTFGGTNTLTISRTATTATIPESADYSLTCRGPGGSVQKAINVKF